MSSLMSRIGRASVAVWILPLFASSLAAQDSPSNKEQMQALSWVIGDWTAVVKARNEVPGVVSVGDELQLKMTCEPRLGDNIIGVEWDVMSGDIVLVTHHSMIGWDGVDRSIVSVAFESNGTRATSTWVKDGDKWLLKTKERSGTGELTTSTAIISDIQKDSFPFQRTSQVADGEAQPDNEKIVFKRVK